MCKTKLIIQNYRVMLKMSKHIKYDYTAKQSQLNMLLQYYSVMQLKLLHNCAKFYCNNLSLFEIAQKQSES